MITANADQDSRYALDVQITNHDGMNNWVLILTPMTLMILTGGLIRD